MVLVGDGGSEDRPADLGAPGSGIIGVSWSADVGLPERPSHGECVLGDVAAELAVCDVDVVVRSVVDGDREIAGR